MKTVETSKSSTICTCSFSRKLHCARSSRPLFRISYHFHMGSTCLAMLNHFLVPLSPLLHSSSILDLFKQKQYKAQSINPSHLHRPQLTHPSRTRLLRIGTRTPLTKSAHHYQLRQPPPPRGNQLHTLPQNIPWTSRPNQGLPTAPARLCISV